MRIFLYGLLVLCSCKAEAQRKLNSGGKLKPEQAIMDIRHYTVVLDLDMPKETISGYTIIDLEILEPANKLVFDFLDSFKISRVQVNGKIMPFEYKNDLLNIHLGSALKGKVNVRVDYNGHPHTAIRPPWDDGFTWTKDSSGNPWMAITAQGVGGKLFFPCKDHPSDEPNEGAKMIITVPKGLVVAGPGILKKTSSNDGKTTFHWETNYTINNYSILFNVGKFELVTRNYRTINGNMVPIQFYVLERDAGKAPKLMDLMEQSLRIREKYFGEYPWIKEKIGIVQTPHLGMEHQTMNAYGNKFRYEKLGAYDFDWLLDHELGHEWWGNKITAKDWAHFWIHEGIDSYGDMLVRRELLGDSAFIDKFSRSSTAFDNTIPVVQGEEVDASTAYIHDIYSKGAYFMHTLSHVTGDSVFFPTLKELATSEQYSFDHLVTTDDVEKLFSARSGKNLKPLFDLFLRTTNKLQIHVIRKSDGSFLIQSLNLDMEVPLEIRTPEGIRRITLSRKAEKIISSHLPEIDPNGYYLKKVIIE